MIEKQWDFLSVNCKKKSKKAVKEGQYLVPNLKALTPCATAWCSKESRLRVGSREEGCLFRVRRGVSRVAR